MGLNVWMQRRSANPAGTARQENTIHNPFSLREKHMDDQGDAAGSPVLLPKRRAASSKHPPAKCVSLRRLGKRLPAEHVRCSRSFGEARAERGGGGW